jgi:type II secretory pathway pseudopilin PulG
MYIQKIPQPLAIRRVATGSATRGAGRRLRGGFALVVSLMLLSLLLILTMGMLSLASISLRAGDSHTAQAAAQANARLALQIAIAQLQTHAGPDQRVTASADLLGETTNAQWTGVWSTTLGDDPAKPLVSGHGQTRIDTSYYTDLRSSDPSMANGAWRNRQFRAWLVSGENPQPATTASPSGTIQLVGTGTVGAAGSVREQVSAPYVELLDGSRRTGGYAWWVGDESLKARVDMSTPFESQLPSLENPGNGGMNRLAGAGGPGIKNVTAPDGSKPYGTIAGLDASVRAKLLSCSTLGMAAGQASAATNFHHLTTHSKGLLVDVVAGSLKKDLTSFLERTGGAPIVSGIPGTGLAANAQMFAPPNFRRTGPSFLHLRNWYDLRKQVQGGFADPRVDAPLFIPTRSGITANTHYNLSAPLPDATRASQPLQPVLTDFRLAFDFSHDPNPDRANGRGIRIHLYPRVTLWNPYNVTLRGQTYYVGSNLPQVNLLEVGGEQTINLPGTNGEMFPGVAPRNTNGHMIYFTLAAVDLAPGEALVFSPDVVASGGPRLAGNSPGYLPANIGANVLSAAIPGGTNNFHLLTNRRVADSVSLTTRPNYEFRGGVNQAFDNAPTMMLKRLRSGRGNVTIDTLNSTVAETLQLIHFGHNGSKFCWWWYLFGDAKRAVNGGIGFESYTSNPDRYPPRLWAVQTRLRWFDESDEQAALGITHGGAGGAFFYNNPVIGNFNVRAQMVFRDPYSYYQGWTRYAPGGFMVPWSTPRLNDSRMSLAYRNGKAYGSPFSAPREMTGPFALFEVPRPGLPLFSLASFQHAQLGYHSWQPTYVIGHSIAEPRSDRSASVSAAFLNAGADAWGSNLSRPNQRPGVWGELVQNLQTETLIHDLTFAANQQLWDRFFLSTIPYHGGVVAWDPQDPLPNPSLRRVSSTINGANTLLTGDHTFDHAAAFLANYGAFNVNSTSVEAWRAMLSSLNDIPRPTLAGGTLPDTYSRLLLPITDQQPLSRNSAGTWSGARHLSATEIESLARTMVAVVRERGPFLGMADFVNRRLGQPGSNDLNDPTLCGPLQAAIDRAGLNTLLQNPASGDLTSSDSGGANRAPEEGAMEPDWQAFYPFKNYGAPGYLTQADVLQTLGHRLTARGDTFVIRTYGDAKDTSGRVVARAWCEAVVQRLPEYVVPLPPDTGSATGGNSPLEPATIRSATGFNQTANSRLLEMNRNYGRRFVVERFRWLAPSEV